MDSFVRQLLTEWRRLGLPFADGTVVVAVSGGADSVSLLLALSELRERKKLDLRLVAAHFDHKLRTDSADDAEFISHLTEKIGVELVVGSSEISKEGNLEQNARTARYEFLGEKARAVSAGTVATGHTVNDQAETFLMNLIRGSGPAGLAGMSAVRQFDDAGPGSSGQPLLLARPLLTWASRGDTENYCHSRQVEFRFDTMNEDLSFMRVRVRKILLPMLKDFNPKIVETLAQTAALMQMIPAPHGPETVDNEPRLRDLKQLPEAELYSLIRRWLEINRGNLRGLELKHIEGVIRLVNSPKSGRVAQLPGFEQVVKRRGRLVFEKIVVDK